MLWEGGGEKEEEGEEEVEEVEEGGDKGHYKLLTFILKTPISLFK